MGYQNKIRAVIICFLLTVTLSGCGGGGGGGGGTTANTAPVANAGPDQMVTLDAADSRTIILSGISYDGDGTIVSHQWNQLQTSGAPVVLNGAQTPTATFTVDATTDAYSFAYTVSDEGGAQSTDTVSVYTAQVIYSESFANADNWTFVDDTGLGDNWVVSGGQLNQTNNLETINNLEASFYPNTSYHLGAYARLDTPSISGAYRFSVDITPLTGSGSQGNDVGIMFGLNANGSSYYRISMSARFGYTRFEKRTGGTFETLAVNARGYVDNQPTRLTAEVNGNIIIVWFDGDPVFAEMDASPLSGTVALYCQDNARFDNVLITEPPRQPSVVIASPLAYSIALTPEDGNTLSARAVALNMPAGGGVSFRLDYGSENAAVQSGNVYTHNFFGVATGEHELTAILKYADGTEASSDINSTVGTGGNYYVTVGDSITNGVGDFNPANNDSLDGRIVAIQGYQASLADALTTTTGLPHIIFNEGISGDRASNMNLRIDSILDRHPGANRVLLMIGTNDAGAGVTPTAFEANVTTTAGIIDDVNGKQVWLARILPRYIKDTTDLDTTRNAQIVEYNNRLQSIVNADPSDDTFLGPDYYTAFNTITLYFDHLHPNDTAYPVTGYQVMADEWRAWLP